MYKKSKLKTRLIAICLALALNATPLTALAANSGGKEHMIDFSGTLTKTYVGIYHPVSGTATGGNVYIDSDFNGPVYGGITARGNAIGNSLYVSGGNITGNKITGGYTEDGDAIGNTVHISGGTVGGIIGGYVYNGNAIGNSVYMSGGTGGSASGGGADTGNAIGNSVYLSGGNITGSINGGYTFDGYATGNSVYISGNGSVTKNVYGGYVNDTGDATHNNVYMTGGKVDISVFGGWTKDGTATGNSVYISGGTVTGDIYGGWTKDGSATGNSVYISGGTVGGVYGGYTNSGTATGNSVYISGGTVTGDIYGGSASGNATGNSVYISGGTVNGDVTGGLADAGAATGNSVYISGGTVTVGVYGGYTNSGTATNNTVTIVNKPDLTTAILAGGNVLGIYVSTGNKLNFFTSGITAAKLTGFEYNNFALFSGGGAGLTLTDKLALENTAIVSAPIALAGSNLAVGDKVTLIETNGITGTPTLPDGQSVQGLALIYDYRLTNEGNKKIIATITGARTNPNSKALSESNLGSSSFVNFGADLAAGKGMDSAVNSARTNADGFSATGMNNLRLNTGSHVDTSGISLMTGFAKKHGDTTLGYFIEGGWSSYDTFNGQDNQGNGHSNYYGLGMLVKKQLKDNKYFDASIRLGQIRSGYTNDSAGSYLGAANMHTNPMYYSAHLGIGKTYELKGKKELDIFARYLYSHVNSQNTTVLGDTFNFDAIDSHRLQLGTKYTFNKTDKSNYYVGLIYEYELSGKAKGSVYGYKLASPSLKGSTGILDIGMQLKPNADSNK